MPNAVPTAVISDSFLPLTSNLSLGDIKKIGHVILQSRLFFSVLAALCLLACNHGGYFLDINLGNGREWQRSTRQAMKRTKKNLEGVPLLRVEGGGDPLVTAAPGREGEDTRPGPGVGQTRPHTVVVAYITDNVE